MKAIQLSGVDIGRKIRVVYKLPRKNAKQHDIVLTLRSLSHYYSGKMYLTDDRNHDYCPPFYADVEYLDEISA